MNVGKMYFYLIKPPFAPDFGLFEAKNSAFSTKTHCNLVQNAVRFGAKCSAFWCKTQGKIVLNAGQFAAKCESKSIKIHSKWYKYSLLEA